MKKFSLATAGRPTHIPVSDERYTRHSDRDSIPPYPCPYGAPWLVSSMVEF